jgi:hypothetical protein
MISLRTHTYCRLAVRSYTGLHFSGVSKQNIKIVVKPLWKRSRGLVLMNYLVVSVKCTRSLYHERRLSSNNPKIMGAFVA